MNLKDKLKKIEFLAKINGFIRGTLQYMEAKLLFHVYSFLFKKKYINSSSYKNINHSVNEKIKLSGIDISKKIKGELNRLLPRKTSVRT